jgi:hypothetical protein
MYDSGGEGQDMREGITTVGLSTMQQPGTNVFHAEMTEHSFHAQLVVEFGTQAEVAARFPKSYRVMSTRLSRDTLACLAIPECSVDEFIAHPDYGHETVGIVVIDVRFGANGVNGGVNETGIKRARSFLAKAKALGFEVKWLEPGMEHCPRAARFGGGHHVVGNGYFIKAQAEKLLGI